MKLEIEQKRTKGTENKGSNATGNLTEASERFDKEWMECNISAVGVSGQEEAPGNLGFDLRF